MNTPTVYSPPTAEVAHLMDDVELWTIHTWLWSVAVFYIGRCVAQGGVPSFGVGWRGYWVRCDFP